MYLWESVGGRGEDPPFCIIAIHWLLTVISQTQAAQQTSKHASPRHLLPICKGRDPSSFRPALQLYRSSLPRTPIAHPHVLVKMKGMCFNLGEILVRAGGGEGGGQNGWMGSGWAAEVTRIGRKLRQEKSSFIFTSAII